jgi:poly-gamma-glutamate synthesis protein (capsule biosynthesis protein)
MKEIFKGVVSILLVVLIGVLGVVIYQNYTRHQAELKALEAAQATPAPTPTPTPSPEPEGFVEPENAANVKLTFCGDIVAHSGLNDEALKADGNYSYAPIFSGAQDFARNADYAVCTLETTFPDTTAYSGYPMFKSPGALATSLKGIGFDLINTASNHSMDSLQNGLVRTLDVLDANGLDHIGTYRTQEERDANNGTLVKDINGVSVAFMSYTYGTNAIPVTGFDYAVNLFFKDYLTTLSDIDYDKLEADMAAARALGTDLVVVMMHWGNEYYTEPVDYQKELADFLFAEGADIIIGGHPHVPEPMELRRVKDNEGNEKTGLLVYSLGNFVSCQDDKYTELTAALTIDIQKNLDTGETYLKNVAYAPLYMVDLMDVNVKTDWRYRLWNLQAAITSYQNGDDLGVINETLYNSMCEGLENLHRILGADFDVNNNGGVDVIQWNAVYEETKRSAQ